MPIGDAYSSRIMKLAKARVKEWKPEMKCSQLISFWGLNLMAHQAPSYLLSPGGVEEGLAVEVDHNGH